MKTELKNSNCNENGNRHWNAGRERKHYKTVESKNRLNIGSTAGSRSGCFVVLTGTILKVGLCG